MTVSVELAQRVPIADVVHAMRHFRGRPQELQLPTAPERPVVVRDGMRGPSRGWTRISATA
jgi:aspartate-semialdehyde dehydrogenase